MLQQRGQQEVALFQAALPVEHQDLLHPAADQGVAVGGHHVHRLPHPDSGGLENHKECLDVLLIDLLVFELRRNDQQIAGPGRVFPFRRPVDAAAAFDENQLHAVMEVKFSVVFSVVPAVVVPGIENQRQRAEIIHFAPAFPVQFIL